LKDHQAIDEILFSSECFGLYVMIRWNALFRQSPKETSEKGCSVLADANVFASWTFLQTV